MHPPSTPGAPTCAIAVIAKAPRPGHVKTRLHTLLTPEEAAAMGIAFLQDTLANLSAAARHAPIAPYVAYAPAGHEARFDGLLPPEATLILADGTNGDAPGVQGFGRVLLHTTRALFARGHAAVCVLGADSPTLPTAELVRAATILLARHTPAVLGPADDGGYWLLGLTEPRPEPFAGITWSSNAAAAETRARCAAAGLPVAELATWHDVDDPEALARLVQHLSAPAARHGQTPFQAPFTAALSDSLDLPARLQAHAA